jgi:alpha-ribazole phosphatase
MRLWFARHGEVEARYVGSFIGRTDANLSDLGRHQAAALAAYLEDAELDAIVSSPRRRALDTAAPLAKAKGLKLDVRPAFAEMDFGDWDGLFWEQIVERSGEHAEAWKKDVMGLAAPGGESGAVFQGRVAAGLEALKAEFKGRTVAVVGHAGVSRAILSGSLGMPYVQTFSFAQDYGNVSAVGWTDEGFAQLALWNFVPGPRAARQGD